MPDNSQAAPDATTRAGRGLTPRQTFWCVLVTFFVASVLWSIANPLMAAVDEPAHMVKAAATVRGELTGDRADHPVGVEDFRLPDLFSQVASYPNCFAFQWEQPASCQPSLVGDIQATTVEQSSAARYNPLYYAIVGLPSLVPAGEITIYLMRAMSGLLAALGLALVTRTLAEMRSRPWLLLGVLVCVTPAVLYLSSSINPQGIELVGALGIWVTLLALLRDPDPTLVTRRMGRLAFAAILLANARGLGPFFAALIVVACVASVPWARTAAILRDRRAWVGLAICVAAGVAAVAWIRFGGSLPTHNATLYPENTPRHVLLYTLAKTSEYIEGTLGIFGWLDTFMPGWLYMMIGAMIVLVAMLGFVLARWRDRIVLLAIVVAMGIIPIAIHVVQAPQIGVFWQGRYILPLAFGVPVLASFAIRDSAVKVPKELGSRLLAWVGPVIVAGQVIAYASNLHRYVNGSSGGWLRMDARSWSPPLNPVLLVVLFAVTWSVLVAVFRRAGIEPVEGPAVESAERPAGSALAAVPGDGA